MLADTTSESGKILAAQALGAPALSVARCISCWSASRRPIANTNLSKLLARKLVIQPGGGTLGIVEAVEQIKMRIEAALAGARLEIVQNGSPSQQHSLLVDNEHALAVANFLREDSALRLDYDSNVTGVDWPDTVVKETTKTKQVIDGVERVIEQTVERKKPGYLEVVHHLYSMELKHGPVILRLRTEDRAEKRHVLSLTPVWRGAEFQEREAFDLYGIIFDGHPDLRRILMWDEFKDHPMRKDYVEPDDYEYEPTAHDDVLEKAKRHVHPG